MTPGYGARATMGNGVKRMGPRLLTEIVRKHPWSSLRDGLVLAGIMTFVVLIALHYDLFSFISALADPRRAISPAEAVVISSLFAGCIWVFVKRRLSEERLDDAYQVQLNSEIGKLRELALQDPLTGLPNRRALLEALDCMTANGAGACCSHAFFLLDLNGFKRTNDVHGHAVGDLVLQLVVERFRRAARPSDLLARLGGDEFAVLSYDVDRAGARAIGERFLGALEHAISADGHEHEIGVAIGGVLYPDDAATSEAILRKADLAMYRAKEDQVSALAFFDPAVDTLKPAGKAAV
jgi:diguanylate cyclase (GGDEF)-like protein